MNKGRKFLRNCMRNKTHNKSFGLGSTAMIEVSKCIDYIFDNMCVFFYQSDLHIESLPGFKKMTQKRYLPGNGKIPGYIRPGIKTCRNSCRNPGCGKFSRI